MSSPRRSAAKLAALAPPYPTELLWNLELELGPLAKASPFSEEGTETPSLVMGEFSPQRQAASLPATPNPLSEDKNAQKRPAEGGESQVYAGSTEPGQGFGIGGL